MSKQKKGNDPGGKHRIRIRAHHRGYIVKAKSKAMKKPRELTGKELLDRIMDELWANIERKERRNNLKKSLTYHHH